MHVIRILVVALAAVATAASCGGGGDDDTGGGARPTVVVTTGILGDVVESLVGDAAAVTTIMPPNASPHEFAASARQVQAMREADLLVVNGAGFEAGLVPVIEAAADDGVAVFEAISAVDTLDYGAAHDDDGHDDDGHDHAGGDEAEAGASQVDPHFFTDPSRMATAAQGIFDALVEAAPELDTPEVRDRAESAIADLQALDTEIAETLAAIPRARRVLVTHHDVFGYFADRYGFRVVGTVIPAGSGPEGTSAADLARLARDVEAAGVNVVFADTSAPDRLARTLAAEAGGIEVVTLFSEALGEPGSGAETYPAMMRTNAERIVAVLA